MHPRVTEVLDAIGRDRADLLDALAAIAPADRERRPAPGRWTAAEMVEHLRLTEAGSGLLLARRIARVREAGVGPDVETGSVLGMLDHVDLVTGGGLRIAPDMVCPRADVGIDEALAGLAASRATLIDAAHQLDDVDGTKVALRHPALGEIDAYQWLLFIGQHERRHARQLRGLAESLAATHD